jgi:hypothetical protein
MAEHKHIYLYTEHEQGGFADVGVIKLNSEYVLIPTKELNRLRKQVAKLETLEQYAKDIAKERK